MSNDLIGIRVRRQDRPDGTPYWQEFRVHRKPGLNINSVLLAIRERPVTSDGSATDPVAWEVNCMEEVCGACAMLINGLPLPHIINIAGKKPWEVPHLDTMELWKFGDYKNYTSLELLSAVFGIPTPKDDIDGSQVGSVYWNDHDLQRISVYCEKDVATCARVLLRLLGEPGIPDANVESVT